MVTTYNSSFSTGLSHLRPRPDSEPSPHLQNHDRFYDVVLGAGIGPKNMPSSSSSSSSNYSSSSSSSSSSASSSSSSRAEEKRPASDRPPPPRRVSNLSKLQGVGCTDVKRKIAESVGLHLPPKYFTRNHHHPSSTQEVFITSLVTTPLSPLVRYLGIRLGPDLQRLRMARRALQQVSQSVSC